MIIIGFEQKLLSIFFTNKETSIKKEKIGDLLTPEGAAKPLTLTKQEIGRNTWALLHSMAASYPNEPTDEDKKQITNFMYGLANLFPCKICGGHLLKMLKKEGVKANSREELVNYICKIHNIVNKVLNKPIFDHKKAFDYWGGDCGRVFNLFLDDPNATTTSLQSIKKVAEKLGENIDELELGVILNKASKAGDKLTFEDFAIIRIVY